MPDHGFVDDLRAAAEAGAEEIAQLYRINGTARQHRTFDESAESGADLRPSFPVLSPSECEAEQPSPYVIKGLLSRGDHAVLIGHPGSGKSVLAPHLAYAVAQGRPVLGRRVKPGPVIYLAAEDGKGMKARVRALRRRWGDAPDFHLIPVALDLLTPGSRELAELLAFIKAVRPVLIVIDTLAKSFPGLRENEGEDMGRVVRVARDLTGICDSAVLSVHHIAKDAGAAPTPKGNGALNADADVTILVEGTRKEVRTVRLGKNRSGPSDATFAFQVASEDLGVDEDGDPITAPIAEETDEPADDRMRTRENKLRDQPAVLLRELRDLVAEQGEPAEPEPGMPTVICVARGMLRKRLIARSWFSEHLLRIAPNGDVELERAGYKPENHALTALKRWGFLAFNRHRVWLL
jgi:hypothetical protein